jgi:hypothetical protein
MKLVMKYDMTRCFRVTLCHIDALKDSHVRTLFLCRMPMSSISPLLEVSGLRRFLWRAASLSELLLLEALRCLCFDFLCFSFLGLSCSTVQQQICGHPQACASYSCTWRVAELLAHVFVFVMLLVALVVVL